MKDLCSKNKYLKTLYNIYKVIIIIFVSSFVVLEGLILLNISETKDVDKVDNIDTMIVLGAKVNGTEVSNTLKLRLDKAIEYYKKHKYVNIIVSGGQGNDENITEALAMKNYLVSNGVNINNIIEENKATTTLENIIYSKKILDNMNNYDMWKRNECYMNGVSYIERGIRWVTQLLKKLLKHICSAVK